MDEETTIAQGLRASDQKAQYDAACKRLLSEKIILAYIMKACLAEYADCSIRDIVEKYIEGQPKIAEVPLLPDEAAPVISGLDTEDKSLHEGQINYDIRFRALVPGSDSRMSLLVNLEAQNEFDPGYPLIKRGIYYAGRMISSQYGREFSHAEYDKIKKVCSIWICTKAPKYRQNTITRYQLAEEYLAGEAREQRENYDLLSVVMVCLGEPGSENYEGVLRLLDVLLSNEISEAEKRHILEGEYSIPMTKAIEREVSLMCNLSQGIEDKGIAKGIEKGRKEGMTNGVLTSIKSLTETLNLSVDEAMAALKLSEEDRRKYLALLAQQ